jgi:hypothetical protein
MSDTPKMKLTRQDERVILESLDFDKEHPAGIRPVWERYPTARVYSFMADTGWEWRVRVGDLMITAALALRTMEDNRWFYDDKQQDEDLVSVAAEGGTE